MTSFLVTSRELDEEILVQKPVRIHMKGCDRKCTGECYRAFLLANSTQLREAIFQS